MVRRSLVAAHTDSDISVHFSEADILHTGDTFWNRDYPFIDYWTGGSIDGQIHAAEANIAKVTSKTIVIPGHGAVGGKADLILFRDVLVDIRDKVAALKKQGKLLPEVIAAKPSARYDAEWATCFRIQVTSLRSCTRAFETVLVAASALEECQQVGVDLLRLRSRHAMRKILIRNQRPIPQQLCRLRPRRHIRDNLVILAMHHQ